ncbi:PaaI family thioesterase [Gordonia sp. TBRC 11910]|uniref:PaaI family thioesterase n=1 Tax=Gordonia asplenii TaxID=2725283 RepID=A0A848KYU4_9ACTN|nr:PaaI family thioesterase [Gordonia asplenii]NMO03549.1 PaaI family thioesterase [Gordonia asplenii]
MGVLSREGPFWDAMAGRTPQPPAARTLGLQFVDADPGAGTIDLAFTAREEWTNPFGNVLGAFIAAMLYDTVGPALLATLEPDQFQSTEDIAVEFIRPLRPGRVTARGRVVERVDDTAKLEATLFDADGPIATCTASARVVGIAAAQRSV